MSDTTSPTTTGYKTPGFWIALGLTLASGLAASGLDLGTAGSYVAMGITGLTAAGYAAFRAFKKSADPTKPAWKTTEFWLTMLAALLSAMNFSGLFAEASIVGKVVSAASGLLALMGYQVTKPKAP